MNNYSETRQKRALDRILDDMENLPPQDAILSDEKPPTLPMVASSNKNAANRTLGHLQTIVVDDDACGDAYLSDARVFP